MTERGEAIGLLVVGHGTHEAQGQRDFWTTVAQVTEELPGTPVAGCFLELASPSIATALATLAQQGIREVVLVPLLLFSAGHAQRDIPMAARNAAEACGLQLRQTDVLGCHPRLLQLSAARFAEALEVGERPADTLLLLVGRGSRDTAATADMHRFAEQRRVLTPVGSSQVAFLAMAHPRIETLASSLDTAPFRRVVVQPHLLYPGALLARLERLVREQNAICRRPPWTLAECLGCDRAVAQTVAERFQEALGGT
jgi:sirohydrochlorin cobaltochelatase